MGALAATEESCEAATTSGAKVSVSITARYESVALEGQSLLRATPLKLLGTNAFECCFQSVNGFGWIATFGLTSAEQEEMAMAVVTMVAMRVDPKIAAMQREGRCRRRQLLWQLQGLH